MSCLVQCPGDSAVLRQVLQAICDDAKSRFSLQYLPVLQCYIWPVEAIDSWEQLAQTETKLYETSTITALEHLKAKEALIYAAMWSLSFIWTAVIPNEISSDSIWYTYNDATLALFHDHKYRHSFQHVHLDLSPIPFHNYNPLLKMFSPLHDHVAVGGTMDHLHAGHRLLLSLAMALTRKRLVVGISEAPLLIKKQYHAQLESWQKRADRVQHFLASLNRKVLVQIVPLWDAMGPTVTDETLEALVVSYETQSGAQSINDQRQSQSWSPLAIYPVPLLAQDASHKWSSTTLRQCEASLSNKNT